MQGDAAGGRATAECPEMMAEMGAMSDPALLQGSVWVRGCPSTTGAPLVPRTPMGAEQGWESWGLGAPTRPPQRGSAAVSPPPTKPQTSL